MNVQWNEQVNDLFVSMQQYLQRAIPEVRKLADSLYGQETREQWNGLSQLMEGIQWMFEARIALDAAQASLPSSLKWNTLSEIFMKLEDQAKLLLPAVEEKDRTLLGDLLNYEVVPLLDELLPQISQFVD